MGALKSAKCSKGHKMTGANLYIRANGQRQCKACIDIRNKAYELRRKQEAAIRREKEGPKLRKSRKGLNTGPRGKQKNPTSLWANRRALAAKINAVGGAEA